MSDALDLLLADGVIDAVLGQLKSGKEASIWRVRTDGKVVAAKVYKERQTRSFRNDAGYREGRQVRNSRTRRAMAKGTRFGQAAAEKEWKSAEADALYALHAEGVRVPKPLLFYEGVLLMELVLDGAGRPAPRLVDAPPRTPDEARALYLDLRAQVVRMLAADLIHGDLSPYNILMGEAGATVIDFPQTVAGARNNQSEFYFRRDLENVRRFLEGFDRSLRGARSDVAEIWNAYVKRELTVDFVPSGHGPERRSDEGRREGHSPKPHGASTGAAGSGPSPLASSAELPPSGRRKRRRSRRGRGGAQQGGPKPGSATPAQGASPPAEAKAPRVAGAPPRERAGAPSPRRRGSSRERNGPKSPDVSYVSRPAARGPSTRQGLGERGGSAGRSGAAPRSRPDGDPS